MSAPLRADLEKTRRRALWRQALLVYTSLEAALWTAGVVHGILIALTVALSIAWAFAGRQPWPDLGLDPASIRRDWWIAPLGAAVASLILLGAWLAHTLRPPAGSVPADYPGVALSLVWAFAQQFLAQSFFFLHFE